MFEPMMYLSKKILLGTLLALTLASCKSVQLPTLFNKGPKELPRYGKDAIHYQCANAQSFGLRMSDTNEEAWLMLPDHEVSLNRDANDKSLYHYGTVDLRLNGDSTTLDDADHLHLRECKPVIIAK